MSRQAGDASSGTAGHARFEIAAVLITGALHLVFETIFNAKEIFLPAAIIFWVVYLVLRIRREPGVVKGWGFRTDNLRRASLMATAAAVPSAVFLGVVAHLLEHDPWTIRLLPLLALYPIWGFLQQFMLQAVVAANLDRLVRTRVVTVVITATLFGLVHAPDWALSGLTFGLALLFVPIYLNTPNLYPLGVYHGWLGALAYMGVLGRDPWAEIMEKL